MLGFCSLSELPISGMEYLEQLRSGRSVELVFYISDRLNDTFIISPKVSYNVYIYNVESYM